MPVVVGVDSSTQSCKVELRDLDSGRLLGSGSAPHPPAFAPRSEQHPSKWWSAFEHALDAAVTHAAVDRTDIAAISVAAQCHGLVPLDVDGEVIRPAKLWNDTTSAPQLDRLRARIGADSWVKAVGSLPTSAFTLSKLAWFAEHEPENFARLARICLPHDWLTLRLSGRHVTDRSEASGTGYWSAAEHRYLDEYLALVDPVRDWSSTLPEVLGPDEPAGGITPQAVSALGLRPDVVIGPGGGDQHAAGLGLAVEPGDVVYTIATSGVVFTTSLDPVFDTSGLVDGVADCAGGYLPLVSTLNAARVTDWAAGILGVDHKELGRLALTADPLRCPVLAAFLDGERKPNRPTASGMLAGITSATTREEIARAAHDGVVLGLLRGEANMNAAGIATSGKVLITGGGARSAAYRQILADLTGREVVIADPADADEATARGAAIQSAAVLTGTGVRELRQAWAPRTETVATPRPGTADLREQLLDRYLTVADWTGFDGQAQR
ncbi:xylulokinase [Streptomyces luteolus]|uniref:Xylulose kinase n=1 Tax=Streptomyces luteolus TaxID=3043615 RepID=A0ABT6STU4_9ACTN|nr:xylulokinase [Streptomyces sp. B-S-A12]MDI3418645.1 xylulokinase [Streptomyces sp. B-S-A12]